MTADIVVKSIIYNTKLKRFLIIKRGMTDDVGADTWENAGGNIENGENPEEALRREIREETGIEEINVKKIAYVTLINADKPFLIIAYLCETLTENVTLSNEHSDFLWADEEECRKKLPKEIIADFDNNHIFKIN